MANIPSPYQKLKSDIISCTRCELWSTRTCTVFGRGPRKSNMMIIGEAPGREEDKVGKAFVGKAGQKLDKLLIEAGFEPDNIVFSNILRCRPPENKFPSDPDIPRSCMPFLSRHINLVRPRVILLTGKQATRWFLLDGRAMGTMRTIIGPSYGHSSYPFVEQIHVTYHPAFLLRANDETLDKRVLNTLIHVRQELSKSGKLGCDVVLGPKPQQQSLF